MRSRRDELDALQPMDEHNRRLESNVRPPGRVNPSPKPRYDLVVLGAGAAGLVAAAGAAGLGGRVALVERRLTGGDCLNLGCVPSKALIRCARAVADVRGAADHGVRQTGELAVDFPAVMARMRRLRADLSRADSVHRFETLGVDVFLGDGRFVGRDVLEVGGASLHFARAVIATGARAAVPDVPGLVSSGFLTNETVFSLTELPRRMLVIGGGPIGCELAQAFARFGSSVTLVETGPALLGREDPDAARIIHRALAREGVGVRVGTTVAEVRASATGRQVRLEAGRGTEIVEVDVVLVGTGRLPCVEGLGLEAAGVEFDSRLGVRVDDRLRTSNPRVFASGDVCSRFKFTHAADAMSRIVLRNALFFGRARVSRLTIPRCTYTDPEVASVGVGPGEAGAQGTDVRTFAVPMSDVDRAALDGEDVGFLKVHVRAGSGRIVGATLVARHAGEMISELTLAMTARISAGRLAATIHPYPTQSDVVRRVGDAFNRTRLTPGVMRWMQRILRWRR